MKTEHIPEGADFERICRERLALGAAPTLIPRIKIKAGKYRGMDGVVLVKHKAPKRPGHNCCADTWRNEATGEILGYSLREAEELCHLRHLRNQAVCARILEARAAIAKAKGE